MNLATTTGTTPPAGEHLLEVRDLAVHFALKRSPGDRLAVDWAAVAASAVSYAKDRRFSAPGLITSAKFPERSQGWNRHCSGLMPSNCPILLRSSPAPISEEK